jgi:division protein CdvB (Snf7/Vps24/ESCRT-III family)
VDLDLVDGFIDKWTKKPQQSSFLSKIKDAGKPSVGLKKQINTVLQRIEVQKNKLNNAQNRFEKRDATLFKRTVKALAERDTMRANVLAGELAEIRKVEKMLMHASLALESISLRLNTVSELGDVVTVLAPAAGVLNNIHAGMCDIFPEAGNELGNIGTLLTDIVSTTHHNTATPLNIGTASLEAEKILSEAEVAAENKLKEKLPEIASAASTQEKTSVET